MTIRLTVLVRSIACIATIWGSAAHADTLLVDRVKSEHAMDSPARGMTMAQVEKRFGAPASKMAPAGGDAPLHPTINRWVYDRFTVYFERDRVISSVSNHATPTEVGPKKVANSQ